MALLARHPTVRGKREVGFVIRQALRSNFPFKSRAVTVRGESGLCRFFKENRAVTVRSIAGLCHFHAW